MDKEDFGFFRDVVALVLGITLLVCVGILVVALMLTATLWVCSLTP